MDPNLYLGEPSEDDGPDVLDFTTLAPIATVPQSFADTIHSQDLSQAREALDAFEALR